MMKPIYFLRSCALLALFMGTVLSSQPLIGNAHINTPLSSSTATGSLTPQTSHSGHAAELINSFEANSDVEAQVKGDYPTMERQESLPLGAIQHAWDHAREGAGIYTVNYQPDKVIRLRVREFMTTSVILPTWEVIGQIVCGDKTAFGVQVVTGKPHILLIEPGAFIGTDTTLTAFGASGNIYVFYLRGEGYNSKNVSDVAVYIRARQVYQTADGKYTHAKCFQAEHSQANQKDAPISLKDADYLEEVNFDPSKLSFAFNMAGNPEIAPERVYSDGVHTWFDYGTKIKTVNLPTIYNIVDGIDTPINVNREGNKLVAQATGSFTLRSGQKVTCVYPVKKASFERKP